jgi:hypothetical protein
MIGGNWREGCKVAGELLTKAWTMARRRHDSGGALAPSDDGAGTIGDARRQTSGTGSFFEV